MLTNFEKIIFLILLVTALVLAINEFLAKLKLVLKGKTIRRTDKPLPRLFDTIWRVLLQVPLYPLRPITGIFHAFVFWGFLIFMFVTINHVFEGFFEKFRIHFHLPLLQSILLFFANTFAGLIIVAVFYFFFRRYVFKNRYLQRPSWQSLIILSFILILMVSFIYYEALKIKEGELLKANYLASFAASTLPENIAQDSLIFWKKFLWWLHILIIMAFGVFIMFSKHLHLIAGPVNLFFRNRGLLAEIPLQNLEELEKFGAEKISDLTKKDLADLFSCAECGRCDQVCPAFGSNKKLSPREFLENLKLQLLKLRKSNAEDEKPLYGNSIEEETVWDCTTCAACMQVCPMGNEHLAKILPLRQYAVMMEGKFPDELQNLFKGLENQYNPWGLNAESRSEWAKELDIPLLKDKKETEILLWVGCAGSYDQQSQKIVKALVKILKQAEVDFAILGNEEKCCGDAARRAGHEYLYQMLAQENIQTLSQYKFKQILTICPHGYHTLKNEYRQFNSSFDVIHHSQFIKELIDKGKIKIDKKIEALVTYHDPCYLGRYNNIYQPARQVINSLTEKPLSEMKSHHQFSFCCGAGGSGMWKEEKHPRINHIRLEQAQETGAAIIVTSCPFCSIMFNDAIAEKDLSGLKTKDIALLIAENL